jgi:hypothetical protein
VDNVAPARPFNLGKVTTPSVATSASLPRKKRFAASVYDYDNSEYEDDEGSCSNDKSDMQCKSKKKYRTSSTVKQAVAAATHKGKFSSVDHAHFVEKLAFVFLHTLRPSFAPTAAAPTPSNVMDVFRDEGEEEATDKNTAVAITASSKKRLNDPPLAAAGRATEVPMHQR